MPNLLFAGAATLVVIAQLAPATETLRPTTPSPYRQLFVPAQPLVPTPVSGQAEKPKPRVIHATPQTRPQVERGGCNMPVIRATPEVDHKIIMPIERQNADPKIRAIEPKVCFEK